MNQNDANTLTSVINALVDAPLAREPLIAETGLVPPEWTDAISKQLGYLFISWRQRAGSVYPGPFGTRRPLSPSEALASWGNRPETSDADYAAIKANAAAIVSRMANDVIYGVAIPAALAQAGP